MAKPISSGALDLLDRVLGLGGGGAQTPQLADDVVSPVLDILSNLVRRSRVPGRTGWFYGVFENVHMAGGALASNIDVYGADAGTFTPYAVALDGAVEEDLELYLHCASAQMTSGSAGLTTSAGLMWTIPAAQQGFGRNNSGNRIAREQEVGLCRWDAHTSLGGQAGVFTTEEGNPLVTFPSLRIPRGTNLVFRTNMDAAATVQCHVILGLFPLALGSDVAQ